nr:hypothetical protein [Lactiplantibacillus plantarum]
MEKKDVMKQYVTDKYFSKGALVDETLANPSRNYYLDLRCRTCLLDYLVNVTCE